MLTDCVNVVILKFVFLVNCYEVSIWINKMCIDEIEGNKCLI